jgi:hypothetical protein
MEKVLREILWSGLKQCKDGGLEKGRKRDGGIRIIKYLR